MCIPCQCPQTLPPPSQFFQKLRVYLQITALILLVFAVFNFIVQLWIAGIYTMLLIYFLYVGWAKFDACSVLIFFIFCLVQSVQNLLSIVSMIEHKNFFPGGMNTFANVVVMIYFVFYTASVFVSHYIYKNFKNAQSDAGSYANLMPGRPNYAANNDDAEASVRDQPAQQPQQSQNFSAFTGQGVRIG